MAYNWGTLGAGAAGGAGLGAMVGGPPGAAVGLVMGGIGGGIAGLFGGKKKDRNVPDPLAGLRQQLQALAGQVPAQVAAQKANTAAQVARAKTEGMQRIGENIHAEKGLGNTSLEDKLNSELWASLIEKQNAADLASDMWGTGEQARILSGTASMYPSQTQLPEEENWQANLLGAGTNMAVQNWMADQQWKRYADLFKNKDLNPNIIGDWQGVGTKGKPGWSYTKI